MLCSKGEKEPKGIPVGFDGILTHPFDVREVVVEELMD
jgi:hypothetical protein